VLGYPLSRLGYPVVIMRLFGFFLSLFFFSFLLYTATLRRDWFVSWRLLYLPAGIVAGALGGFIEAKVVIRKLKEDVEIVAWSLLPAAVLWTLPFGIVLYFFGGEELLPFAAYFFLPSIPAALGTSSLLFRRFERKEGVQVFMFVYGYKFWIETPADLSVEFAGFVDAVISEDFSWVLYYGRHSDGLEEKIKEIPKNEIGSDAMDFLLRVLNLVGDCNKKRFRSALIFTIFNVCWLVVLAIISFASASLGIWETSAVQIVVSVMMFAFIANVTSTIVMLLLQNRKYKNKFIILMQRTNPITLSNLKGFAELRLSISG